MNLKQRKRRLALGNDHKNIKKKGVTAITEIGKNQRSRKKKTSNK